MEEPQAPVEECAAPSRESNGSNKKKKEKKAPDKVAAEEAHSVTLRIVGNPFGRFGSPCSASFDDPTRKYMYRKGASLA